MAFLSWLGFGAVFCVGGNGSACDSDVLAGCYASAFDAGGGVQASSVHVGRRVLSECTVEDRLKMENRLTRIEDGIELILKGQERVNLLEERVSLLEKKVDWVKGYRAGVIAGAAIAGAGLTEIARHLFKF